jgi:hypothetical protein
VFVFDAVESVTAMTVALNAVITPWVVILAIGALRTKAYDPTDLQAFAHGYTAVSIGSPVAGTRRPLRRGRSGPCCVLAVNTTLYVGPLADIAGGVDVSTVGSAVLAGLIFFCANRREVPQFRGVSGTFASARAGT